MNNKAIKIKEEKKIEKSSDNKLITSCNIDQETVTVKGHWSYNLNNPPVKVPGIRLNIGSGVDYKPDFLNIDKYNKTADADWDIVHLPLRDNSVAQIISYAVLEHLPQLEILPILKEWCRVLKPNGNVVVVVPDMVSACQRFINNPDDDYALVRIYGHQADKGQFHKSGFTPKKLFTLFGCAGFRSIGISYFDEKNKVRNILVEAIK